MIKYIIILIAEEQCEVPLTAFDPMPTVSRGRG